MKLFTEERTQEYFKKAMHPNREMFVLVFGRKPTMLPHLKVLGMEGNVGNVGIEGIEGIEGSSNSSISSNSSNSSKFLLESSKERPDSLVYWVTDTALLKLDTLRLEMTYLKTDSLEQLTEQIDTLVLKVPKKRAATIQKKKKDAASGEEKPKIEFINLTHNFKDKMEITDTITINFAEPIKTIVFDSITLSHKVDTLFNPVPITFETPDSVCNKQLRVIFDKKPGETYKFNIDSAAITSIYGHHNTKFYKTITFKRLEEYANLYITFPENPSNAIFELMDAKEKVLYRSVLEDGEVAFQDIIPGKYYLRMIIDANGNGVWDTGVSAKRLQPENVFYMPEILNLPANWDVEQVWDYQSFDILKQRPAELNNTKKKK